MRNSLALLLVTFLAALPAPSQTALRLRWNLEAGVQPEAPCLAVFTLTNRDAKALPSSGWAIYFNAQNRARITSGSFRVDSLGGDLYKLAPTSEFRGLAQGKTLRIEYSIERADNAVSIAPSGPYLIFDDDPGKGVALKDYQALPFRSPWNIDRTSGGPTPEDIPLAQLPLVFPSAVKEEKRPGRLRLSAFPNIHADPELAGEAELAAGYLRPHVPRHAKGKGPALFLELGAVEGQISPEAYELRIDPIEGIHLRGVSAAGVFYGLQTLRGLLPVKPGAACELPALVVVDAPRFGYRGLHLDVARNFQPKASILKVLDLMARIKLNALHFHLTDDEGWRLEIPSLPELIQVGSRRGHTLNSEHFLQPAYGSGPDVDKPFGSGHYSKNDYIEILKFANARHIEVIPELEMPGHARAAVKAMEARFRTLNKVGNLDEAKRYLLSDPEDASVYNSAQAYHDNVMNPALPSTYAFIARVVEDLTAMHREAGVPLRNLHMGGDEVPAGVWEKSPAAQAFMKSQNLRSADDFWFLFYGRVEAILKTHGIPLSGWEEIGVRKEGRRNVPNPDFANRGWRTYVWNNLPGGGNEDLAYSLANHGYKVVLCPVSNLYFDLAYSQSPEEPGLSWGGYVDVDKPFNFIPTDYYRNTKQDSRGNPLDPKVFEGKERLTASGRTNILGIEACLWSETLNAPGRLDYMLVPKFFGLAERAWAPDPAWATEPDEQKAAALNQADWSRFTNILGKRELPRLDRERPDLQYRIPTPKLQKQMYTVFADQQLPGFTLRYTTDGSEPTTRSPRWRGPVKKLGVIRVAAFDTLGRRGKSAQIFVAD